MTADAMQGALFTHRNHYLFADYYLDRRACERQEWREADAGSAFADDHRALAPFQAAR